MTAPDRRFRILVVDDEAPIREPVARALGKLGYDVTGVPDADEALFFLSQQPVEVVILDIRMPGMGGLELLEEIRTRYPDTIPIIMTGTADPDGSTFTRATELGAFAFLKKPLHFSKLKRTLGFALEHHTLLADMHQARPADAEPTGYDENGDWVASTIIRPTVETPPEKLPPTCSVLIIDADESWRVQLARELGGHGHKVSVVSTGTEALAAIDSGKAFGALIIETNQPGMDGPELLREVRSRLPGTIIIVLTDMSDRTGLLKSQLLDAGADTFLRKPIRPSAVHDALQEVLARIDPSKRDIESMATRATGKATAGVSKRKPATDEPAGIEAEPSDSQDDAPEAPDPANVAEDTSAAATGPEVEQKPEPNEHEAGIIGIIDDDDVLPGIIDDEPEALESKPGREPIAAHLRSRIAAEASRDAGGWPDRKYSILLSDADESHLAALFNGLTAKGYDAATARSAGDALAFVTEEAFDAVITDIGAGGVEEIELLRKIREKARGAVLIVMSHATDRGVQMLKTQVMDIGAFAFVRKPFRFDLVENALREGLIQMQACAPADDAPVEHDTEDEGAADSAQGGERQRKVKQTVPKASILLVEDDRTAGGIISKGLASAGHDVAMAPSPTTATEAVSQEIYDVIIFDLRIPLEDAEALLGTLRTKNPTAVVIILTAAIARAGITQAKATELGAHALARKPTPLAQIKRIVQEHMGQFEETDDDQGPEGVAGRKLKQGLGGSGSQTAVLIVDSEQVLRDATAQILRRKGLKVETASNGDEVLLTGLNQAFDAIAMDITLPGMNGMELLRRLRQQYPDAVIVVASAAADPQGFLKAETTELGVYAFLRKPVGAWEIERAVEGGLAERAKPRFNTADDEGESIWDRHDVKYSLLLVDDEAPLLQALSKGMSGRTFEVVTARNADEAALACDEYEGFDAMVIDVRMPGKDGIALVGELKEKNPDALMVMLTALADSKHGVEHDAIEAGAYSLLKKPIRVKELNRHVREGLWLRSMGMAIQKTAEAARGQTAQQPAAASQKATAHGAQPGESGEVPREERIALAGRSILVIDADKVVLDEASKALTGLGCTVATARNSQQALSYRSLRKFDAFILDVDLPGTDALELLRQLKVSSPDAIAVVLSNTADPPRVVEQKALAFGARAIRKKPLPVEELVRHLQVGRAQLNKLAETLPPPKGASGDGTGMGTGTAARFPRRAAGQYSVLAADDDQAVLDATIDFLTEKGYDVVIAHDGAAALAQQWREKCDAVLMDVRMPIVGGMAALERLKDKHANLVVIMMTDESDPKHALESQAKKLGAAALLKKPLRLEEVERTLRDALPEPANAPSPPVAAEPPDSPRDASPQKDTGQVPAPDGEPEIVLGSAMPTTPHQKPGNGQRTAHSRPAILVIDPADATNQSVSRQLSGADYEIEVVPDGEEAVFLLSQQKVDVVVIDMTAPNASGIESLRAVKTAHPDIAVIALAPAGKRARTLRSEASRLGATACLDQPLSVTELDQSLQDLLGDSLPASKPDQPASPAIVDDL